jgi:hypothetical protein
MISFRDPYTQDKLTCVFVLGFPICEIGMEYTF